MPVMLVAEIRHWELEYNAVLLPISWTFHLCLGHQGADSHFLQTTSIWKLNNVFAMYESLLSTLNLETSQGHNGVVFNLLFC